MNKEEIYSKITVYEMVDGYFKYKMLLDKGIISEGDNKITVNVDTTNALLEKQNLQLKDTIDKAREYIKLISSDYDTLYNQDIDLVIKHLLSILDGGKE